MRNLYRHIHIFAALILSTPLYSDSMVRPAVIDSSKENYTLGRNLEILEDRGGTLNFAEVKSPAYTSLFKPSEKEIPNFSFSKSVYWIRFSITFPHTALHESRNWIIKCGWPNLTSVTAYIPEPGGRFRITETGTGMPVSSKEIPNRAYLFRLAEQPGETVTVYMRVRSTGVVIIPVSVISEQKFFRDNEIDNIVSGAFLGIILIMIFYHLLLYMAVRDRDYLYFILFLSANILYYVLNEGVLQTYIGTGGEERRVVLYAFTAAAAVTMNTMFSIHILNLREDIPAAAKTFYLFIAAFILLAFSAFIIQPNKVWTIFFILSAATTISATAVAFIRLIQGYSIARYFFIIMLLQIVSNYTLTLIRFDIITINWFTEHVRVMFAILQALILSYAISLRIRRIERERISAQALAIENLEKAERIKDEFLANTSHELKTPLHGIVGLSDLMLTWRDKVDSRIRENLQLISGNGRRLMSLVNDILDFSSIRNGSMALKPEPVDLRGTVSAIFSLLRPLTEGKAIELRNSIPADFTPVFADEERLRQVFTNLVGNSLKFTPFGVIEVSAVINSEGMSEITASDTGVGIKPENLERIFNAFEQEDSSISRSRGGTGLGLAITKKFIELHGGTISVKSEPGKGASFTFTLPAAAKESRINKPAEAEPVTSVINPQKPAADIGTDLHDKSRPSILVVDDDPVSLKILRDYLTGMQYNIYTEVEGASALEKIRRGPHFDLILLDVMMPVISGYDILKKIRDDYSHSELPVMLITAKSQMDDINAGFEAGANDYIIKPFSIEELSHRVENMLRLKNVLLPAEPGVMIKERGTSRIIQYKDIIYLSAAGKKTIIHTTSKDEEVSLMLKDLEVKLPRTFVRIHRQYIINTLYLARVTHVKSGRYEAVLNDADDTRLMVGRINIADLKAHLDEREALNEE